LARGAIYVRLRGDSGGVAMKTPAQRMKMSIARNRARCLRYRTRQDTMPLHVAVVRHNRWYVTRWTLATITITITYYYY
jgi:hypothetical protein